MQELSGKTSLTTETIINEYLKPYEMVSKLAIVERTKEMLQEANTLGRS